MGLNDFFRLLRVEQWYKNIIIFISLIFSFNLFNKELFISIFLGFISLCLISSSYYIINDLNDIKKDKSHPEKKKRPLASGKIKHSTAILISFILLNISLLMAYSLSKMFLLMISLLFLLSQIYTFFIRNTAFLDIIFISTNFVIRAISGTFIIRSPVSSWVILSTFFLSSFLVSSKRTIEISSNFSKEYRKSYGPEDKKVLEVLSMMSITLVFVFFSVYSVLNKNPLLLLSLPVAIYIILLFFREAHLNPEKIRNPEKFILEKRTLIAIIIWLIIIVSVFYYPSL